MNKKEYTPVVATHPGELIKDELKERQMTQKQLAELTGIKPSVLSETIKDTALCGLGQTSPNPVLSTINNFWDEYVEHVKQHKCRAKQCKALVTYSIDPAKCKGCGACKRKCPANAIMGDMRKPHIINPYECIRCGMCKSSCRFEAISIY